MGTIKKTITIEVNAKDEEEMETKLGVLKNDIKFINREYKDDGITYEISKIKKMR